MRILGAIIAGGKARRFGSDKALARIGDRKLIDIVLEGLRGQVADSVVCGRQMEGLLSLEDRPHRNLGPLGGLCAALNHGHLNGYDAVLSVGVDIIPVPAQLSQWLLAETLENSRATVVNGQHLLGLWPTSLAARLDDHLDNAVDRSIYGWIAASGAVTVTVPAVFNNINTLKDLLRIKSLS